MYHFDVKMIWENFTAQGDVVLAVRVNGIITEQVRQTVQSNSGTILQVLNANLKLYSGDVVDVIVSQNSSASQNVNLNQLESIFAGYKVY